MGEPPLATVGSSHSVAPSMQHSGVYDSSAAVAVLSSVSRNLSSAGKYHSSFVYSVLHTVSVDGVWGRTLEQCYQPGVTSDPSQSSSRACLLESTSHHSHQTSHQ